MMLWTEIYFKTLPFEMLLSQKRKNAQSQYTGVQDMGFFLVRKSVHFQIDATNLAIFGIKGFNTVG